MSSIDIATDFVNFLNSNGYDTYWGGINSTINYTVNCSISNRWYNIIRINKETKKTNVYTEDMYEFIRDEKLEDSDIQFKLEELILLTI